MNVTTGGGANWGEDTRVAPRGHTCSHTELTAATSTQMIARLVEDGQVMQHEHKRRERHARLLVAPGCDASILY